MDTVSDTWTFSFSKDELFAFVDEAGKQTWAGDGAAAPNPQRDNFEELIFERGDFFYRDSFVAGDAFSWGTELVSYLSKPVWNCLYGGGMIEPFGTMAAETFSFLKKALVINANGFQSMRGPRTYQDGEWSYSYDQSGDVSLFQGEETITYQGKTVFFYHTFGGAIL
ncbi:hypothetical protein KC571_03845 [candidate division WWE3 bacterium]|uniref:DUF5680 domain-containing protein n=1 Tax=candidate division WWE3 bacterium TaxID=2053526 RepID=A0A955LHC5_UNCKA|nr:hypothetical protein [candidate division WWE3 bacterium]